MPSSDHVDHAIRQQSEGGEEKKSSKGSTTRGRRGICELDLPYVLSPTDKRFVRLVAIDIE